MAHSRSLTAPSIALRLRVSTEKPSSNFKLVVQYIMMVSYSWWFKTTRNYTIYQEPQHVFDTLLKCQKLLSQVKRNCNGGLSVIERNVFGAHHESILVAMASSTI